MRQATGSDFVDYPMNDDLLQIKAAIRERYGCDCRLHSSALVSDRFNGKPWDGRVEIWTLIGCLRAEYCYGWRERDGEVVTVLQVPPIISPHTAVRSILELRRHPGAGVPGAAAPSV